MNLGLRLEKNSGHQKIRFMCAPAQGRSDWPPTRKILRLLLKPSTLYSGLKQNSSSNFFWVKTAIPLNNNSLTHLDNFTAKLVVKVDIFASKNKLKTCMHFLWHACVIRAAESSHALTWANLHNKAVSYPRDTCDQTIIFWKRN